MIVPGPFGKTPASVPMTSATGFCLDLYRIRGEIPYVEKAPNAVGKCWWPHFSLATVALVGSPYLAYSGLLHVSHVQVILLPTFLPRSLHSTFQGWESQPLGRELPTQFLLQIPRSFHQGVFACPFLKCRSWELNSGLPAWAADTL